MNPLREFIRKCKTSKKNQVKPVKAIAYANNHFEEGGTSLLYECWIEEEREIYVAKILQNNHQGGQAYKCFQTECKMLKKFKGKSHIIPFLHILEDQECIMLPKMKEDLCALLDRQEDHKCSEALAKKIFKQVCTAVRHLHKEGVAHVDIKAGNVLRGFDDNYYLSDLGSACKKVEKGDVVWKTRAYASPEISGGNYEYLMQGDIWRLGVLLYGIVNGHIDAFGEDTSQDEATMVIDHMRHFYSSELCELLSSLLQINPLKRPQISEVLHHPWMSDTNRLNEQAALV